MARILGAARLSHHTDASTSIERQTDQITGYAASVGATLVHITADTDVSGKVAPQDRPMLGADPPGQRPADHRATCAARLPAGR
jgi:hypothetical protein